MYFSWPGSRCPTISPMAAHGGTCSPRRGVDVTVPSGELLCIMGSAGSGKSTLMNVLGCLDVPTAGHYVLDGIAVDGLDRNALADLRNQKLGVVFQGFNLLARTSAVENVELPL